MRYTFIPGAVATFITGVPSLVAPLLVIQLSGLDPKATPAIQQAGALTVGFFVAWLMCLQATNREQVKITTVSAAIVFVLSAIGAFYYVVLQGVVAPGLIVILVVSILMAVLLGYYYFKLAA